MTIAIGAFFTRCVRWWTPCLAMLLLGAPPTLAAAPGPPTAASEDLGGSLFDESIDQAQPALPTPDAAEQLIERPESPIARAMLDPLRQLIGAVQGVPSDDDWLQVVTLHMEEAQGALAAKNATGGASAAQRAAVNELDALLVRMQKQCDKCCSQCNKPSTSLAQKPKEGKAGAKPGASTARAGVAAKSRRTALHRLVKDRWGGLPERQRDELLQPLSEEFVPEYATDTEEYFRALADPTATKAAGRSQP